MEICMIEIQNSTENINQENGKIRSVKLILISFIHMMLPITP
jgi:hypothetical protein